MIRTLWLVVLLLSQATWLWGASSIPVSLVRPRFLTSKDKAPLGSLAVPDLPPKDKNGRTLDGKEDVLPPSSNVMDFFSDPGTFETIKTAKRVERDARRFYWHRMGDLDYCHYRSLEGDNWYGWEEEGIFYYVLWRGNRFWWKDPFAGLWLYYFRGYWWRSDGQDRKTVEACVDGEYYLCDRIGKVIKDMGQDGQGVLRAAPGLHRIDLWRQRRAQRQEHGAENGEKNESDHHDHGDQKNETVPQPPSSQGAEAKP